MSLLDEYNIEPDPRLERAQHEAKVIFAYMITMGLLFFATAAWGALSYDGQFEYILGFPTYMFFITVELILFAIAGFLIAFYYIEDTSLEAWRS